MFKTFPPPALRSQAHIKINMTAWPLVWRQDVPDKFKVSPEVHRAIVQSIQGLNPHQPAFYQDRCYSWTLWNCLQLRGEGDDTTVLVKTPLTSGHCGRTQNLRTLLAYHYFGQVGSPVTASGKPCPCGAPNKSYGECCFPTVHTICHRYTGVRSCGICVNPTHMERGLARDQESDAVHKYPRCQLLLQPTAPCAECQWDPQVYKVTECVDGFHPGPPRPVTCRNTQEAVAMLGEWRLNGIINRLNILKKNERRNHAEIKHVETYLLRTYGVIPDGGAPARSRSNKK